HSDTPATPAHSTPKATDRCPPPRAHIASPRHVPAAWRHSAHPGSLSPPVPARFGSPAGVVDPAPPHTPPPAPELQSRGHTSGCHPRARNTHPPARPSPDSPPPPGRPVHTAHRPAYARPP